MILNRIDDNYKLLDALNDQIVTLLWLDSARYKSELRELIRRVIEVEKLDTKQKRAVYFRQLKNLMTIASIM